MVVLSDPRRDELNHRRICEGGVGCSVDSIMGRIRLSIRSLSVFAPDPRRGEGEMLHAVGWKVGGRK